ncbi:MAG TPA: hypothetical protein VE134_01125, partial [Methanomicrobiales archaeon]|nr:hypothetical protein [Methanomicrobiales archaeon]
MGYSPADSADILQIFSPSARDFLSFFNKSEIMEILEALLFIYIAENSHTTNGRGDGAYGKCSPKGTLALKECGLVQEASWQEVQVLRTTRQGARVGSALLLKRIHSLNFGELARRVHPLVPFLLAGSSHYRYVEKSLPLAMLESDDTFLSFVITRNPVVFRELENFSRTLAELGLAVVACGYPPAKEGEDCWQYVFPGELVFILNEIVGEYGEEISRKYLEFVEYIRRKFIVLQFLSYKRYYGEIVSSRGLQADLITYLDMLSDSIEVI